MKTLFIYIALLAFLAAGCGGETSSTDSKPADTGAQTTVAASQLKPMTIDASGGEQVKVRIEVADDEAEREKGLMDRTSLGKNRGMLFVFPDEEVRSFWMRNTLIPLSIAYIDSEKRIIDLQDMKALDDQPPHYTSAKPAQYALEVNKGFFDEHGVKVGDKVELPG